MQHKKNYIIQQNKMNSREKEEEKSVEDDSPTPKQVRKIKKYKKKVKLPK